MRSKYKNQKVVIDGIKFDSKLEAKHYLRLSSLQDAGKISNLTMQPKFLLQKSFKSSQGTHRAIHYVADFQYLENGETVVVDVKGMQTDVYKIKKKLFIYKYPQYVFKEVFK